MLNSHIDEMMANVAFSRCCVSYINAMYSVRAGALERKDLTDEDKAAMLLGEIPDNLRDDVIKFETEINKDFAAILDRVDKALHPEWSKRRIRIDYCIRCVGYEVAKWMMEHAVNVEQLPRIAYREITNN